MATGAIRTDGCAVNIRMAGNAFRACLRKNQGLVAIPAIYPGMAPGQRKSCSVVVEREGVCIYFPTESGMAIGAIGLKAVSVRGLRKQAGRQPQQQYYWWQSTHSKLSN